MIPKTCPFKDKEKLWTILHGQCHGYGTGWGSLPMAIWPRGHRCDGCSFIVDIWDAGIIYAPYIPVQTMKVKK